jgi:predicted dehydrogenase
MPARSVTELRAAVVGTGFIGVVHVEALRRLGVQVTGVVGSSPERASAKKGTVPLPEPYTSFDVMLADASVDVVHLATPNHLHYAQAKAVLAAGKSVVCEKPLALNARESAELLELAEQSGLVHCVNFNIRFYPQCQEARHRVLGGEIGDVWNIHGQYLQDWLLLPTDWNWRLEPELGGEIRALGDIGSHWLDLAQFVSGRQIEALIADLHTAIPVRQRPTRPVETFALAAEVEREPVEMRTEDVAHLLFRLEGGGRGSVVVSQVSAGRKNRLVFEVDGSDGSIAWDSERNEELWLGHRERANELLLRDPSLLQNPSRGSVPGGHAEGFQDTFKDLYAEVYRAVAAGGPSDGYPTFRDGHWENVLAEAALESNRRQGWVEAPT